MTETDNPPGPETSLLPATVVLVGLMGAGKSSVGRFLAQRFGALFADADREIEQTAGCTIAEFFQRFGEPAFRRTEEETIVRLVAGEPRIVATGGGAFMSRHTRDAIRAHGVSLWIRADLDTLHERVSRRSGRPLLETADPRATLEALMHERYPVYAEADLAVNSGIGPVGETVDRAWQALSGHFAANRHLRHDRH